MPGESPPPRMAAEVLAWQVVLYWWNRQPGTGTTHPPHPALLRPSPCNPTSIRRQVLRLLYGSGTGSLSCLSFARAYFVVPLYQYMRKRETHHYLFVASFNAQTTKFQHFLNHRRNSDKISSKSEQQSVKKIQK